MGRHRGDAGDRLGCRQSAAELTAEQIHQLGLQGVARIRAEREKVKTQLGFQDELQALFTSLENDPRNYFTNGKKLLVAYQELEKKIDSKLPLEFDVFPAHDDEVREIEPYRAQRAAGPPTSWGHLTARGRASAM